VRKKGTKQVVVSYPLIVFNSIIWKKIRLLIKINFLMIFFYFLGLNIDINYIPI